LRTTGATLRVAAALTLAIALAACTGGGSPGSSSSGSQAANGMTISLASPADGAQVSVPFAVTVDSSVPLGPPESGNHHAHLYLDSVTTNQADYDILYSNTWQVTRPLAPGKHTLIVALANPDHSLAGPQQSITVDVTGSGGGGGSGASAAPSGSAPAPSAPPPSY